MFHSLQVSQLTNHAELSGTFVQHDFVFKMKFKQFDQCHWVQYSFKRTKKPFSLMSTKC